MNDEKRMLTRCCWVQRQTKGGQRAKEVVAYYLLALTHASIASD